MAKADEAESLATIDRALELGVDFLDTADMYGPHINEELVGRALKGKDAAAALRYTEAMMKSVNA